MTTTARPRRRLLLLLTAATAVTTALTTACGSTAAPAADSPPAAAPPASAGLTLVDGSATGTGTAARPPRPRDEIPARPGDGVNERLLPTEELLGEFGWNLTGRVRDLTAPYYRHPCSPPSAVTEWSRPISNVGRVWDVRGTPVGGPAVRGEIAVDLYGYGSAQQAQNALARYLTRLDGCTVPGPGGTPDQVIANVDLDPDGTYPLDEGVVVRVVSSTGNTDVLIARTGQILIVTAYAAAAGGLDPTLTTAASDAVLDPTKQAIGMANGIFPNFDQPA